MSGAPLPTSAFDYELPPGRIAQRPSARRDASRLLVLARGDGRVEHRRFSDLPALIEPGDVVVLNESRVIPARLVGRRPTGGEAEVLLVHPATVDGAPPAALESDPRLWLALVRPGAKLKPGRSVTVAADLVVRIIDSTDDGARLVRLETELPVAEALHRHGRVPLPPYISREPTADDAVRYQTVFARAAGSVAAPTAGLHFTPALLDAIEARGAALARLVLHVGIGTFRPVETEDPAAHRMHAEWY
ncbi:MAG: S-adenosylmethionine:tRNA ribosyltransferase-isomerase, partial [Longimicrobiales bacterium]